MRVIYEVRLFPQAQIVNEFMPWLQAHVIEMTALPGFVDARILLPVDAPGAEFVVQYQLVDQAALETYLREHAERMREHGLQRFPGQFRAERRVYALHPE